MWSRTFADIPEGASPADFLNVGMRVNCTQASVAACNTGPEKARGMIQRSRCAFSGTVDKKLIVKYANLSFPG